MKTFGYENFNKRAGFFAVGMFSLILAITNVIDPPGSRPSGGRWGWLFGQLWDWFGAYGGFYYWAMWAAICLICFLRTKK